MFRKSEIQETNKDGREQQGRNKRKKQTKIITTEEKKLRYEPEEEELGDKIINTN